MKFSIEREHTASAPSRRLAIRLPTHEEARTVSVPRYGLSLRQPCQQRVTKGVATGLISAPFETPSRPVRGAKRSMSGRILLLGCMLLRLIGTYNVYKKACIPSTHSPYLRRMIAILFTDRITNLLALPISKLKFLLQMASDITLSCILSYKELIYFI